MSHAGYYPGGKVMTMKVVFERGTGRLLGAQIVGYEGVDKRIDVLATAIRAGLSAVELKELDLAYAPPYSSAKDPVNMAGFMIENLAQGLVKQFGLEELDGLPRDGSVTLLDVRTPEEYAPGPHPRLCQHPGGCAAGPAGGNRPGQAGVCDLPERPAQLSGLPDSDRPRL